MSEASTAKAIRGLTVAIWALVVVFAVSAMMPFVWMHFPLGMHSETASSNPEARASRTAPYIPKSSRDEYEGFHDWPIEKQVASASAIVLTKHSDDGERLTSTVSEILKLAPGTTLYYKVGDEYKNGSRYLEKNVSYGDGEIIFFTGSPAQMRFSTSHADGRCRGLGDMPIETLKEIIATQSKEMPNRSLKADAADVPRP
jgi:hypothetical protein